MEPSILNSIKKVLGLADDDTAFDTDIVMHINSVLSTLNQIGVGPEAGFAIEDAESTWSDLLGEDHRLNMVKSYVYLKVRLAFDPPGTSFAIDAISKMADQYEWRICNDPVMRNASDVSV